MEDKKKPIIRVGPSRIIIENYDYDTCPNLYHSFSIWNMVYHKYELFAAYYDKDTKTIYLPRGIDLPLIIRWMGVDPQDVIYEPCDEYEFIDNKYHMITKPRDEIQEQAIRFMLGEGEYIDNKNFSEIGVNLFTGKGKSFCAIHTILTLKIKTIIITFSINILKQWKNYFLEYTNMEDRDIYLISGSTAIDMLLQNKSTRLKCPVYLVTHSTLRDYANIHGWDKIRELFQKLKIGLNMTDEAHLNFENICLINFFTNVFRTYFITASPARSSQDENKIYQLSMKNVPSIELFDEETDNHVNYLAIKWNSKPTVQQISNCRNQYGLDRNKYINYVVRQPEFYKMLHLIMKLVLKLNAKSLFYIDNNESLLVVYNWLCENYPEFTGNIGIYTTLIPSEYRATEKFDKQIILTTTKSGSTAEHIPGLKLVVVLAAPYKSAVTAMQALGRLRDPNTYFIELVDVAFRYIKKYYYYKLPTYNKYALSVSDMNLSGWELDNKYSEIMAKRDRVLKSVPVRTVDTRFNNLPCPVHKIDEDHDPSKPVYFFNN